MLNPREKAKILSKLSDDLHRLNFFLENAADSITNSDWHFATFLHHVNESVNGLIKTVESVEQTNEQKIDN